MARVRFQVSIKDRGLAGLFNKISALVGKKFRNNFGDLRPAVEIGINEAVENNKNKFIPTIDEIGELGVGEGGRPDSRAQVAWLGLKTDGGATKFTVRKKGVEGSSTIGEIRISIDEEAFYSLPDSNIDTESEILPTIQWMRWLIQGQTISSYSFSETSHGSVSRTGRGVMVGGGLWSFQGRGAEIYARILDDARLSINRKLKGNEGVSILRRLR